MSDNREESVFGRIERPSLVKRAFKVIIYSSAACVLVITAPELYSKHFEFDDPVIDSPPSPIIVGGKELTLDVKVSDRGAGVDQVSVELQQGGFRKSLGHSFGVGSPSIEKRVTISQSISGIVEGSAVLIVTASDHSLWMNEVKAEFPVIIDSQKPVLEVLPFPSNVSEGSPLVVAYRVTDANLARHGLETGERATKGIPATYLGVEVPADNWFAALVAVPAELRNARVFAEDHALEISDRRLPISVRRATGQTITVEVDDKYLEFVSKHLFANNVAMLSTISGAIPAGLKIDESRDSRLEQLSIILKHLIPATEQLVSQQVDTAYLTGRIWRGKFSGDWISRRGAFVDRMAWESAGKVSVKVPLNGILVEFADGLGSVQSLEDGVVGLVGDLGTLKGLVVINHGAGVSSLYSGLDVAGVNQGTTIRRGQTIGRAAARSFWGANRVLVQVRINGAWSDPEAWMDPEAYASAIEQPIRAITSAAQKTIRQKGAIVPGNDG